MLGDDDDGPPYVVLVVAGLLVGVALAPVAVGVADRETPTVAVIPVEGGIDGTSAAALSEQVERARTDPSVKAVVLLVNSPGGAASASETQYLAVKRLAAEKPVVASVDGIAASGAYYTIAPADAIYVKPSSIVGSVGVIAPLPRKVEPNNLVGATGPNKVGTDSIRDFKYTLETLKNAFANAVVRSRGDTLELSRSEVTKAGLYSGVVAVENGMADRIGGRSAAVAAAADRAGLEEYTVEVYRPAGPTQFVSQAAYVASTAPEKEIVSPAYLTGIGSSGSTYATFLMVPPRIAYPSDDGTYLGTGAYDNSTARNTSDASAAPVGVSG
ncbi:MAG: S49 family peptidase [Halosegnis sp.]